MAEEKTKRDHLESTVVRICPACGVVNPAGPADSCPHLQLARFDGLEPELQELLAEVAAARNHFRTKVSKLKDRVKAAVKTHTAEIETPHKTRPEAADKRAAVLPPGTQVLSLEPPPAPKPKPRAPRKRSRPKAPVTVNPRQLELIAREPPKGEA